MNRGSNSLTSISRTKAWEENAAIEGPEVTEDEARCESRSVNAVRALLMMPSCIGPCLRRSTPGNKKRLFRGGRARGECKHEADYVRNLWRANPASPIRPLAKSVIDAGSGTDVVLPSTINASEFGVMYLSCPLTTSMA